MNKYDFDFMILEDVLDNVLGIGNPTDIFSLKMQISDSLNALSNAIDCKSSSNLEDKMENQKRALYKELDAVTAETNIDKVLRKCVTTRYLTLLSLEVKIRNEDSYEERAKKQIKRNEIFAISDLVKSIPSIINLMDERRKILTYIDSKNRIISFDRNNYEEKKYSKSQIDICYNVRPNEFQGELGKVLVESGINAYDFGTIVYSFYSNEEGIYTKKVVKKKLVGIVKRDEFGKLSKYSVLMEENYDNISPIFFRDVLFSDMLLRNSKNNCNYLGSVKNNKVVFDSPNLIEMLKAIYFENRLEIVQITSNYDKVKSVKNAYDIIQEKLEQIICDKKILGDDR